MSDEKTTRGVALASGGNVPTFSKPPYMVSGDQVVLELDTDGDNGLPEAESLKRREQFGPNELDGGGGVSPWKVCFHQYSSVYRSDATSTGLAQADRKRHDYRAHSRNGALIWRPRLG